MSAPIKGAEPSLSHPWQSAVFLSDAHGYFGGEALVVGAEEDVVVAHQRGAADGREPARGIHLRPHNTMSECYFVHKFSGVFFVICMFNVPFGVRLSLGKG